MLSIWSLLMLKGKATPRLTLNYGVRYEYNSVWEETNVRTLITRLSRSFRPEFRSISLTGMILVHDWDLLTIPSDPARR